jgi:hypothetical protein
MHPSGILTLSEAALKPSEGPMKPFRLCEIGFMGFFFRGEYPNVVSPPTSTDFCVPPSITDMVGNSLKTGCVAFMLTSICLIFRPCRLTQIHDAIIGGIPIDMVNCIDRPRAVSHKPCQTMLKNCAPANHDLAISPRTCGASATIDWLGTHRPFPRKDPRYCIVVQKARHGFKCRQGLDI